MKVLETFPYYIAPPTKGCDASLGTRYFYPQQSPARDSVRETRTDSHSYVYRGVQRDTEYLAPVRTDPSYAYSTTAVASKKVSVDEVVALTALVSFYEDIIRYTLQLFSRSPAKQKKVLVQQYVQHPQATV